MTNQRDEQGRPMTYWGGNPEHVPSKDLVSRLRAEHSHGLSDDAADEIERLQAEVRIWMDANNEWLKANGPGGWIDDLRQRAAGEPPAAPVESFEDLQRRSRAWAQGKIDERTNFFEAHRLALVIGFQAGWTERSAPPPFLKRRPHLEESDAWASAEDERDWWRSYALQIEGACLRPTKRPECQHDKSKPGPTLVPLGSAAFGSSDWTWMCTVCNHRFDLPMASASSLGEGSAP